MEGLSFKSFNGEVEMRKTDHQLQQGCSSRCGRRPARKHPYSVENTGYNFQTVEYYEPYVASTPTSCEMKRPGAPEFAVAATPHVRARGPPESAPPGLFS